MEVSQLLDARARLVVVPAEVATPGVWWSNGPTSGGRRVSVFLLCFGGTAEPPLSRPSVDFPAAS
ncbi:hypothetical protein Cci01nite_43540 [Catellatospora citrea]|uniref:Uncharacterized protein n=1 Tax=Catellatospora citrea TaxID=53366 RepID=A0A8J3P2H4_9ACTN|nr:hypothetical protein Cci01nite_43540 [Catellatospora citrea]